VVVIRLRSEWIRVDGWRSPLEDLSWGGREGPSSNAVRAPVRCSIRCVEVVRCSLSSGSCACYWESDGRVRTGTTFSADMDSDAKTLAWVLLLQVAHKDGQCVVVGVRAINEPCCG